MILPAAMAWPIYIPAVLLLGLLGFITIIAFVTRAISVAALAIGLNVVAGGLLVLWTSYLNSSEGPFEYADQVFLRLIGATFVGLLIIQGLIARRCWHADRARRDARRAAARCQQTTAEDYDRSWLLSLLQKQVADSREKVSTSAAAVPTGGDVPTDEKLQNP